METTNSKSGFIAAYRRKTEHTVLGIMSGTSLDGVDAVLVSIKTTAAAEVESVRLIKHSYLPYTDEVRGEIASLCTLSTAKIDDLVYTHFGLSEWYAAAALQVISEAGFKADQVDVISMHGQTVWHAPVLRNFPGPSGAVPVKGTLQLGSGPVVQERTGIPVISDLRSADMAAGGEGAPLAPFIDHLLFGSPDEGRIVQNIGGIGNATILPPRLPSRISDSRNSSESTESSSTGVFAFDTGPGNMIIDAIVGISSKGTLRYDAEGGIAARGTVSEELVEEYMQDAYFKRKPPKSTGREIYGVEFAQQFMQRTEEKKMSHNDAVATATAFTAETIARAYQDFVLPYVSIAKVLVCGGGALNTSLLKMIQKRLPEEIIVTTAHAFGIPDQAREAMAFAVIGHESLMGRPGSLPAVTGARKGAVLGVLTLT
jgi:anhydro-N-acetylmuramic acid kinase